jgi:hypothetical protein
MLPVSPILEDDLYGVEMNIQENDVAVSGVFGG